MLFLARARRVSASSSGLSSTSRIMRSCGLSVEHFPDRAGDGVGRERLLQVGRAGLEDSVPLHGFIGVARHEDHTGIRAHARETDRELAAVEDRKSTRLNSSHSQISYAVFCLKKKN